MEDKALAKQTFEIDSLKVEIYPSRAEMGIAAGRAVAGLMRKLLKEGDAVRMIFAAAPSQNEFLAELASAPDVDWSRVTALHMDEYVGLSADAPQSFVRYLREHLFDQVQPGTVHLLNGVAPDPTEECDRYAKLVNQAPVDILCAGIGENGHLAFNDPPADFKDPHTVKVVDLALSCRQQQVNDGCFSDLESVPSKAYTLTVPALMSAHHAFCVVPGPTKAEAVRASLQSSISTACPATILRTHEKAILYVDAEAASLFLPQLG